MARVLTAGSYSVECRIGGRTSLAAGDEIDIVPVEQYDAVRRERGRHAGQVAPGVDPFRMTRTGICLKSTGRAKGDYFGRRYRSQRIKCGRIVAVATVGRPSFNFRHQERLA